MRKLFTLLLLAFSFTSMSQTTVPLCFLDSDLDGFGDPNHSVPATTFGACPLFYVSNSDDCNDNDATLNPNTVWFRDLDNDGYYDGTFIFSCTGPTGYIRTPKAGFDCNDLDPFVNPSTKWYSDYDGDLFADHIDPVITSCTDPGFPYVAEYRLKGDDCVPADPTLPAAFYIDADQDGYPSSLTPRIECYQPEGYVRLSELTALILDCDDNDNSSGLAVLWYLDSDNDGWYTGTGVSACSAPAPGYRTSGILGGDDCNDSDPLQFPGQNWYEDNDGDGHGKSLQSGGTISQGCNRPAGKWFAFSQLESVDDCNDGDATINPETTWYLDADGDGYHSPIFIGTPTCTSPGPLFRTTTLGVDCNDNNAGQNPASVWVLDSDGDGYYGASVSGCIGLAGYALLTTQQPGDCNDNDASINPATTWYLDADGDGYHSQLYVGQPSCTRPGGPEFKTTTLGVDCNDNSAAQNPTTVWILDADGDGFYSQSFTSCFGLTGYIIRTTQQAGDCNDSNPSINAASPEICGNKIDDNCNNLIDDGNCSSCQNGTGLNATGVTSATAQLNWSSPSNPTQWQVEYKGGKGVTKWVAVPATGDKRFITLSGLQANQQYSWKIRAYCAGKWSAYSATASFTTTGSIITGALGAAAPMEKGALVPEQLALYPNPTRGSVQIQLQLKSSTATAAVIRLTDMTGSTFLQQKSPVERGWLNAKMQVPGHAAAGLYVVQVIVDGKAYKTRLVVLR